MDSNASATSQESYSNKQTALLHNIINPGGYLEDKSPAASNASLQPSDNQGKRLLDQILSGAQSQETLPLKMPSSSDAHQPFSPPQPHAQRPSYDEPDYQPYAPQRTTRAPDSGTMDDPPSPRKSMFDFVSPFDALSGPVPSQASASRKKQPLGTNQTPPSNEESSSFSMEDKRNRQTKHQSVENLLATLTSTTQQDDFGPTTETYPSHAPYGSGIESRPPLAKPAGPRTESPRGNSSPQQRNQRAALLDSSPVSSPAQAQTLATPQTQTGRDIARESSPISRWKGELKKAAPGGGGGLKKLSTQTAVTQPQTVVIDVAQPDVTMAPRDFVKTTAIALVRIEPIFLPGSTIGATTWIAYAMTKGRVRVISRSSGDRTLLQLPSAFSPSSSVIDMVVSGNRLAGVTNDGGLVVWELPDIIEDNVAARLLVCLTPPQAHQSGLRSVKWHPKQPEILAVATDTKVHLLNVEDAARMYQGQAINQIDLHSIANVFQAPSPIVGFAFDVSHHALATLAEDSTITLWSVKDKQPFWSYKVLGEGQPSSIDFLDGGLVVGRKNGTIFQLLAVMGKTVLSTVRFVNGNREDREMFGHVVYDSRIQTLWVANSRRESLFALRVCLETASPSPAGEEIVRAGYFEKIVEFAGPKPSIHFVILNQDSDPHGDEAHAACIAAKITPGPLSLVAFSVHSTGVDQILIRKEWFDSALNSSPTRTPDQGVPPRGLQAPPQQSSSYAAGNSKSQGQSNAGFARARTPPSEEVEVEISKDENAKAQEGRGKGNARRGAYQGKDAEKDAGKDKGKEQSKTADVAGASDTPMTASLTKEIRKMEENLHTRIGRLMAKELDKQQHRLEEIRQVEQRNEFERQQTILKLISTELTKNTTRVVESAVKNEVQGSVLPSLEAITRNEVKAAMNSQISNIMGDSILQTLPAEIERLLMRPDISNHIARSLTTAMTPLIEKHVKDAISKSMTSVYAQSATNLHQELSREIHTEIASFKKEMFSWQGDALRSQENLAREMDRSLHSLADQVKLLTLNMNVPPPMHPAHLPSSSPKQTSVSHTQLPSHLRQAPMPISGGHSYSPQSSYTSSSGQTQVWYGAPPMPPQATPPRAPQSLGTTGKTEDWEEKFLSVLAIPEPRHLRELLARSQPEVILPSNGNGPLSQAVVLTLVHRLAQFMNDMNPADEGYKTTIWWLHSASDALNPTDPLIVAVTPRIMPMVQQILTSARQRLILPGMPAQFQDSSRKISDIQDTLGRKPMPPPQLAGR